MTLALLLGGLCIALVIGALIGAEKGLLPWRR
jgi:hypothetical protein